MHHPAVPFGYYHRPEYPVLARLFGWERDGRRRSVWWANPEDLFARRALGETEITVAFEAWCATRRRFTDEDLIGQTYLLLSDDFRGPAMDLLAFGSDSHAMRIRLWEPELTRSLHWEIDERLLICRDTAGGYSLQLVAAKEGFHSGLLMDTMGRDAQAYLKLIPVDPGVLVGFPHDGRHLNGTPIEMLGMMLPSDGYRLPSE